MKTKIFLLQYNRRKGQLVTLRSFDDTERATAGNCRLELELDLNRKGVKDEVVLLEAVDLEALRRTHRRYFEDAQQIWTSTSGAAQPS
jgi:hypothetical protein